MNGQVKAGWRISAPRMYYCVEALGQGPSPSNLCLLSNIEFLIMVVESFARISLYD